MPSQISPPIEYSDGDPINAAAFNGHVKNATLQNGSITEQTDISLSIVPTVDKLDSIVIYDQSETTTNRLRKTNVESIFTTGAPIVADSIVTPIINASANKDIDITPNLGAIVSGKAYFSADGYNITVTSTGHLLETGMLVEFTNATNTHHQGRFQITILSADTFTYNNGRTTGGVIGSGTLDYRKAATVSVIGNQIINDDLRVAGDVAIGGKADIAGHVNVGSLKIGGKTPMTVEDSSLNISTKTVMLGGADPHGLPEYATQSFNVPPGETWTFVWTATTFQWSATGNTRPEAPFSWQIVFNTSPYNTVYDSIPVGGQSYGGSSITTRSIVVKNEGETGYVHTIVNPSGGVSIKDGALGLAWVTTTDGGTGRWKWDTSWGQLSITLYKQKTAIVEADSVVL